MEMGSGGVAVVRLALRDCCFGSFQEVFGRAIQQFTPKHIEEIFFILQRKREEMKELFFRGFDPYIQCVGYYTENSFGTHLNRDIVRLAGQLNLAIDFSLYQVSAYEHDG
jgi:hypothetical protein